MDFTRTELNELYRLVESRGHRLRSTLRTLRIQHRADYERRLSENEALSEKLSQELQALGPLPGLREVG